MVSHAQHLNEIKDHGIILTRKWVREDDVTLHVLSRRYGQVLLYAHKAAISKRRFLNCCEIFRHVHFFAKRSSSDFWTLEEIHTLNYFKPLTQLYTTFCVGNSALHLIRHICPLEHPAERLYTLLGGFLQFLTENTTSPHLAWGVFELKVFQEAGLFSMNLIKKLAQDHPALFNATEIFWLEKILQSHHQRWLFTRPEAEVATLKKLDATLRRLREDYGLSPLPKSPSVLVS